MVAIKKLEDIVKKWVDVTPGRQPYFEAGVRSPLRDWATEAAAAEDAWESGVTQAVTDKRFQGGVKRVGTEKWQKRTLDFAARFSDGVRKSGDYFNAGFAPYHEVIAKVTLPKRAAKGAPENYERVKAIGDALHKKKLELRKGGGT